MTAVAAKVCCSLAHSGHRFSSTTAVTLAHLYNIAFHLLSDAVVALALTRSVVASRRWDFVWSEWQTMHE